jgi:hypothetical protein
MLPHSRSAIAKRVLGRNVLTQDPLVARSMRHGCGLRAHRPGSSRRCHPAHPEDQRCCSSSLRGGCCFHFSCSSLSLPLEKSMRGIGPHGPHRVWREIMRAVALACSQKFARTVGIMPENKERKNVRNAACRMTRHTCREQGMYYAGYMPRTRNVCRVSPRTVFTLRSFFSDVCLVYAVIDHWSRHLQSFFLWKL